MIEVYDPVAMYMSAMAFEAEAAESRPSPPPAGGHRSIDALGMMFLRALVDSDGDVKAALRYFRRMAEKPWKKWAIAKMKDALRSSGADPAAADAAYAKVTSLDDGALADRMFRMLASADALELKSSLKEIQDAPEVLGRVGDRKIANAFAAIPRQLDGIGAEAKDAAASFADKFVPTAHKAVREARREAGVMPAIAAAALREAGKAADARGMLAALRRAADAIKADASRGGGTVEHALAMTEASAGGGTDDAVDEILGLPDPRLVGDLLDFIDARPDDVKRALGADAAKFDELRARLSEIGDPVRDGAGGDLYEAYKSFLSSPQGDAAVKKIYEAVKAAAPAIDQAIDGVAKELGVYRGDEGSGVAKRAAMRAVSGGQRDRRARESTLAWFVAYPAIMAIATSLRVGGGAVYTASIAAPEWALQYAEGLADIAKVASGTAAALRYSLGARYGGMKDVTKDEGTFRTVLDRVIRDNRQAGGGMLRELSNAGMIDDYAVGNLRDAAADGVDMGKLTASLRAIGSRLADPQSLRNVVTKIYAANGVKKTLAAKIGGAVGKGLAAADAAAESVKSGGKEPENSAK